MDSEQKKQARALRSETFGRQQLDKILNKYPKRILAKPSNYMYKKLSKEILALREMNQKFHSVSVQFKCHINEFCS